MIFFFNLNKVDFFNLLNYIKDALDYVFKFKIEHQI